MATIDARGLARLVFALLLVIGAAREHTHRLERSAERQIRAELGGRGQVRVSIEPQWGALGVLLAKANTITVTARGFDAPRMPFFTEPDVPAWRGTARQVRITMEDFRLRGLPVRRMEATIPGVTLDSRAAAFRLRIRLFGAGWGEGWVILDEAGLTEYIRRRLPEVRDAQVKVSPNGIRISGELTALLASWKFEATGQVAVRDARQVVVADAQIRMEGEPLASSVVQKVLSALNPVLDIERDLQIGSAFRIERVELGDGILKLIGRATVPPRTTGGVNGDREQ